jgi:site-specific DNA-methyltransferase (adenine-specific)
VDVVITSPPYNLGIGYNTFVDRMSEGEYFAWMLSWCSELRRVLRADGSFFLNLGASPSKPLLPYLAVTKVADTRLFQLQNTFHWIKSISIRKENDWISAGHFKPLNSKRFVNDCHEFVFHLTPSGNTQLNRLAIGVPYADKSNISRWGHTAGRDKRCRGNNWFIPYRTIQSRAGQRPHPATFPTELATNAILLHGASSEICVLDPFNGIGHTALAAVGCGVGRFYGFDIDPEYHAVTVERLRASAVQATETNLIVQE